MIYNASYTRDQVPVSLTIYLKWQLTSPLMVRLYLLISVFIYSSLHRQLTTHGYNTPYDALRVSDCNTKGKQTPFNFSQDKAQSVLTQIGNSKKHYL